MRLSSVQFQSSVQDPAQEEFNAFTMRAKFCHPAYRVEVEPSGAVVVQHLESKRSCIYMGIGWSGRPWEHSEQPAEPPPSPLSGKAEKGRKR